MYSQYYPGKSNGSDTKINRQAWFKQCLDRIAVIPGLISVAFPYKIGCGMAGGDWSVYEAMTVGTVSTWIFQNSHIKIFIIHMGSK